MFVDADDYIEQGAIKKCVSVAERRKPTLCILNGKCPMSNQMAVMKLKQFNVEPFHGKTRAQWFRM